MKRIIFLFFLFLGIANANYSELEIANALKFHAHKNKIDQRILYTLAKIESNFNPKAISFLSKNKNINIKNIKIKTAKYNDKYLISIYPHNKKTAIQITKTLIKQGYSVDVGLMQINSNNFQLSETKKIFDLNYNIEKSVKILKQCIIKKQNVKESIECYNKGFANVKNFSYFSKFKDSFLKDFL